MVYTYNGVAVTTMAYFSEVYEIPLESLNSRYKQYKQMFNVHEDFYFLNGQDLSLFKKESGYASRTRHLILWTENGLKKLLGNSGCRSEQIFSILGDFDISVTSVITNKEYETLKVIQSSFNGLFSFEKQKRVLNYRIDLYIPELKVAVECDEDGHSQYANDEVRQKAVENELGCTFIRYNPDDKDFNIGVVINQIMKKYLEYQNKTFAKVDL